MATVTDKNVAVVGGGPGGLTLARLLQLSGVDVTVYERDSNSDARAQGATLDLHDESGLRALRQAGLMEAFQANYRPGAEKLRVMDKHAHVLWDEHGSANREISRPEIDRGPLQKILLDSLRPDSIVWNSHRKQGRGPFAFRRRGNAFLSAEGSLKTLRLMFGHCKNVFLRGIITAWTEQCGCCFK